jgi:hypothetical protein
MRQAPVRHGGHRGGKLGGDCATLLQKTQETTQCSHHQLGVTAPNMPNSSRMN